MTAPAAEWPGNRRWFARLPGGGYSFTLMDDGVRIEGRHLRRERHQLFGEVDVLCDWAGVQKTHGGMLSSAELNLSSQSLRVARGKYCQQRARTKESDFDWIGTIDDFCCRVIEAERQGEPAIVLDDAPADGPPADFNVHGILIPADSHSQMIVDGGGLKSLLLLLVLGEMAQCNTPVLMIDWEWNAARHKGRKVRLFGTDRIPCLHYLRCRNALTVEHDHIRRICDEHGIRFIAIDSISAACDGKLADDDVARAYNRALDDLPPSLAAAHVTKAPIDPAADYKAFGSAFFHNYARMTWSVKKKQLGELATVMLVPHKQNDGVRLKPVGLEFDFSAPQIQVRNVDPLSVDGLAETLPLRDRMPSLLRRGPLTMAQLADELGAKLDTVEKTVKRHPTLFTRVLGQDGVHRIGLVEKRQIA